MRCVVEEADGLELFKYFRNLCNGEMNRPTFFLSLVRLWLLLDRLCDPAESWDETCESVSMGSPVEIDFSFRGSGRFTVSASVLICSVWGNRGGSDSSEVLTFD